MTLPEFLDTEWHDRPPFTPKARDAWRIEYPEAIPLPISLVRKLAQPNRLAEISLNDRDLLDYLTTSIGDRGFDEPMMVVLDDHGRVLLRDGHHRLIAASVLGLSTVPVVFQQSKKINIATAQSVAAMLPRLLSAVRTMPA